MAGDQQDNTNGKGKGKGKERATDQNQDQAQDQKSEKGGQMKEVRRPPPLPAVKGTIGAIGTFAFLDDIA